jgi:hypothetical protein
MRFKLRRKSKVCANAIVYFTSARNEDDKKQICVYAACTYGGGRVGPVWGHSDQSIGRVLATLTKQCGCGRSFHRALYYEGKRVLPLPTRSGS